MTLAEAKKIFEPEFLGQLDEILINGNFGDIVMNHEAIEIIEYFRSHGSKTMKIDVSTNGGARNSEFWTRLAQLKVQVVFCLDGLEDTHSIYRKNTVYSTVIKNAKTFIEAGGKAIWKFIVFDHNKHQVEEARAISKQLKFLNFFFDNQSNRTNSPVFDKDKKLIFVIGEPSHIDFDLIYRAHSKQHIPDLAKFGYVPAPISCEVEKRRSVYINSIGEVYPCCYIGFNPLTFNRGAGYLYPTIQIRPLVTENSALEFGLKHSIEWFGAIKDTWDKPDFESGKLITCSQSCGQKI